MADAQAMLWRLEAKYGPVLAEPLDRIAVAHAVAALDTPTPSRIRQAFESAGFRRPAVAYATELAAMLARQVKRKNLLDLILDFRQHALSKLGRRFRAKTTGREDELRDYLITYLVPRGYAEAEAGIGNTDILVPSVPAIIECKVWGDREYHEKGLEQLRRYIRTDMPKEAYMVVFGHRHPLPSIVVDPEQAIIGRPVLTGLAVPVIAVLFEVDTPSNARAMEKRRAKNGRR